VTVLGDPRLLVETGDRNVYNLSQIPMLQGYNIPSQTRHIYCNQQLSLQILILSNMHRISQLNSIVLSSFYRYGYGDASLAIYENMVKTCMNRSSADESGPEFCGTRFTERTHGTNSNINWSHNLPQVDCSSFNEHEPKHKFLFGGNESLCRPHQMQPSAQELMPNNDMASNLVELKSLKRKVSDTDIDLNLSLKLSSRVEKHGSMVEHEVDSNLSLSLCSQSSSSWLRKSSQDHSKEQGERTRTLDLTIWMRQNSKWDSKVPVRNYAYCNQLLHILSDTNNSLSNKQWCWESSSSQNQCWFYTCLVIEMLKDGESFSTTKSFKKNKVVSVHLIDQ